MSAIHSVRRSPEALRGRSSVLLVLVVLGILAAPLTAGVVPLSAQQSPEEREAGRHLGHIMSGWEETPEGRGLLAVAVAETQVASRHATLAVRSSENLEAMKTHARHVLHALDPSRVESGPGLGYGVIRVSEEIADHVQLAVEAVGYAGNIANRAPAVTQSADNAARWAREMVDVIAEIQAAETASEAEPLARELRTLANRVVSGADLNDDDEVRWQDGEGGIMHVQQHMSLLMRVDGRWYFDRSEVGAADDSGATGGDSDSGDPSGDRQEPSEPN